MLYRYINAVLPTFLHMTKIRNQNLVLLKSSKTRHKLLVLKHILIFDKMSNA